MHHKRQSKVIRAVGDVLDLLATRRKQESVGRVVDRLLHLSLYCFEQRSVGTIHYVWHFLKLIDLLQQSVFSLQMTTPSSGQLFGRSLKANRGLKSAAKPSTGWMSSS